MITQDTYRKWLKAAYQYYWGTGESEMSDYEWDQIGRKINPEDFDELRGTKWVPGSSLFWLSKSKYPEWAKE